jgi:hypothetical protein
VVPNDVGPRGRHERCQSGHEIDRIEDDVSGAVAPAVSEAIEDPAVGELGEALAGDRRPRPVAGESLEAPAVARGDADVRVEAKSLDARAARARNGLHVFDVGAVAEPQQALAGVRAGGDAALDRRRVELGEQGLVCFQGIRVGGCVLAEETLRTSSFPTRCAMAAVIRAISSSVGGGSG